MEITNSLDLPKALVALDNHFYTATNSLRSDSMKFNQVNGEYLNLRNNIVLINTELSRLEVEARRTKNRKQVDEKLKQINAQFLFMEQNIMFMSLGF